MKKGIKIDTKIAREFIWDELMSHRHGKSKERPDNWNPFVNYNDFVELMRVVRYQGYPTTDWIIDCMVKNSCDYWDDRIESTNGYLNNLSYDGVRDLLSGKLENHVWGIYEGLKMHEAWQNKEEFDEPFFNAKQRREDYEKYQQLQELIKTSERNLLDAQEQLAKLKKKQGF